ncbi:polysaccharide deacetylase family protein [Streptomyces coeruleorubidus]|uniref:polysaccharide deacetylase family protein n=1 Tax=Streptomyces coeruleorubidus TaxID=116188 RepID=UPI003408AAD6
MALPANFSTVKVFGRYIDINQGTPMQGSVTFTMSQKYLVNPSADVLIFAVPIVTSLDETGYFEIDLPATDDPDVIPQGYTWTVTESFNRKAGRTFSIAVPQDTPDPGIDLVTIAPVLPADNVSYTVTSVDGMTGTVDLTGKYAPLGEDGKIPVENIPSISAGVTSVNGLSGVVSLGAGDVGALPLTGGTMQGPLNLQANPTDPTQASTKAYVDSAVSGLLSASGGTVTGNLEVNGRLTTGGRPLPLIVPSGRRPAYRKASWSQQFQTGHGWAVGGSGTASSNANDGTEFVRGAQSVRVTTAANGVQSQVRKLAGTTVDMTGKVIRIVLKVDDVAHLDRFEFLVGTSSLANYYRWTVHTHSTTNANYVQSGEWVTIHLNWADVTAAGGSYSISASGVPNVRSGFTDMQFNCYDDAAGAVTYRLQAIELVPDTSETFPNGVVSITFDDSYSSVYSLAKPKMDALGFQGTMFNIAEAIGSGPSYLTVPQMRIMQDYSGWEQGGHAYGTAAHAARYTTLTEQAVDDDFRKLRSWMVANSFTSEHFAYPGGQFGKTTDGVPVDQIAARYFTTARSIVSETVESFAPAMPHRLKAVTGINDASGIGGVTVASLTAAGGKLDRCLNNGDWLILCLHKIVAGTPADSTEIGQAGFNTLMDAIASRGIPVVTVSEAMRYYS